MCFDTSATECRQPSKSTISMFALTSSIRYRNETFLAQHSARRQHPNEQTVYGDARIECIKWLKARRKVCPNKKKLNTKKIT